MHLFPLICIVAVIIACEALDPHSQPPHASHGHGHGHRQEHQGAGTHTVVPRIAVLTSPSSKAAKTDWIPAAYINWLQSAGAIAVPIPSGVYWNTSVADWFVEQSDVWSDAMYEDTFRSVNGLLIPGGNPWPQVSSKAFRKLMVLAKGANEAGDHFPVFGICAGMQTMAVLATEGCQSKVLDGDIPAGNCGAEGPVTRGFDSKNMSLALDLQLAAPSSRLFETAPSDLLARLKTENLTFNYHSGGVKPSMFHSFPTLNKVYDILSVNRDRQGRAFVSTIEGKDLPFYGVQWHPAKAMFEHGVHDNHAYEAINHSAHAIEAAGFMATFFVNEARKSSHMYASATAAAKASIANHVPSAYNSSSPMYMQAYHFEWP